MESSYRKFVPSESCSTHPPASPPSNRLGVRDYTTGIRVLASFASQCSADNALLFAMRLGEADSATKQFRRATPLKGCDTRRKCDKEKVRMILALRMACSCGSYKGGPLFSLGTPPSLHITLGSQSPAVSPFPCAPANCSMANHSDYARAHYHSVHVVELLAKRTGLKGKAMPVPPAGRKQFHEQIARSPAAGRLDSVEEGAPGRTRTCDLPVRTGCSIRLSYGSCRHIVGFRIRPER